MTTSRFSPLSIAATLAASLFILAGGALSAQAQTAAQKKPPAKDQTTRPAAVSVRRDAKAKAGAAAPETAPRPDAARKPGAGATLDDLVTANAGPDLANWAPEPEAP